MTNTTTKAATSTATTPDPFENVTIRNITLCTLTGDMIGELYAGERCIKRRFSFRDDGNFYLKDTYEFLKSIDRTAEMVMLAGAGAPTKKHKSNS